MEWIIILRLLCGVPIGIIFNTVPLYCKFGLRLVKEIAPKEYSGRIMVFFVISFALPDQWSFYMYGKLSKDHFIARMQIFLIAVLLSGLQLILCLFVFRSDTPRESLEENDNENCAMELNKIYSSATRREEENDLLRTILYSKRTQYPSYRDLLRKGYRQAFVRGLVLMSLRNFSGYFSLISVARALYARYTDYLDDTLGLAALVAMLFPLFLIDSRLGFHRRDRLQGDFVLLQHWDECYSACVLRASSD